MQRRGPPRGGRGVSRAGRAALPDMTTSLPNTLPEDIRQLQGGFPRRVAERIEIAELPDDAGLLVAGLQQRLLSSIEAFARSLAVHRASAEQQWRATGSRLAYDHPRVLRGRGPERGAAAAELSRGRRGRHPAARRRELPHERIPGGCPNPDATPGAKRHPSGCPGIEAPANLDSRQTTAGISLMVCRPSRNSTRFAAPVSSMRTSSQRTP